MRSAIFALSFILIAAIPASAKPTPRPGSSGSPLDAKTKKEVLGMEKQLSRAVEEREGAVLEKVLDEVYYDAYEGAKRAMSKSGTIARCKAGVLNFLVIENEPQITPAAEGVLVEGRAKLNRVQIDDVTPERWVHVRRLWSKKDGAWRLTSQIRRWIEPETAKE